MMSGYGTVRAGELPLEVTGFVGRERELQEVGALLGKARLVSLTGPAGVGKTRLALRAARTALPRYPDGICFIELSSLRDPVLLPHTVAAALGLSEHGERDPVTLLVTYLTDKRLLLVLDTCEHLLDACAMLADLVLRKAPGVTVLATSRQPLDTPGEFVWPIAPLPTDDEAVRLFAERAAAVVPGFTLTEDNRDDVIAVCRWVEGMPLAVELAVVRLRALSLGELAARLRGRLQALTGGRRAAVPEHHRTLRATLDWSHELCTPQEQVLWRRLSVFAGDFDARAAEEVCGGGELPGEDVLDPLIGLIDKSVVLRIDDAPARYRLLDTLREYGAERLAASGEEDTFRRQHLAHLEALAERADSPFHSDEQADRLRHLGRRVQDFRVALQYALAQPTPVPAPADPAPAPGDRGLALRGLALATRLWTHWVTAGHFREGARWLREGLDAVPQECPERVEALHRLGWMLMILGRYEEAAPPLREALETAERLGDERGAAYAVQYRGCLAMVRLELAAAHRDLDEARRRFRALGDTDGLAVAAFEQTFGAALSGDAAHAWRVSGEALEALASVPGECWTRGYCLLYRQLALWQSRNDPEAIAALAAAYPRVAAVAADLAGERDRLGREALVLKQRVDDRLGSGIALELLAWSAAESGRCERAAWLLGAAHTLWEKVGCTLFDMEILVAQQRAAAEAVRAALGSTEYEALHARGAALDTARAVAYAAEDRDVLPEPHRGAAVRGEKGPAARQSRDRAPVRPGGLTRREREVAALVAQGLTNREIAERLVVSKRTVDAHVEHILNKLGFTSRTQITAAH
ncbi:LuxR C-terminal-related transcriptional regulator [Streptomyces sp. ODS28]|uniref:helix-turn-helix transcriptional regulator n=1 Tax=Streptomyces sp. ODS28 TaxID=3136688 RepID=UPI0031E6C203